MIENVQRRKYLGILIDSELKQLLPRKHILCAYTLQTCTLFDDRVIVLYAMGPFSLL